MGGRFSCHGALLEPCEAHRALRASFPGAGAREDSWSASCPPGCCPGIRKLLVRWGVDPSVTVPSLRGRQIDRRGLPTSERWQISSAPESAAGHQPRAAGHQPRWGRCRDEHVPTRPHNTSACHSVFAQSLLPSDGPPVHHGVDVSSNNCPHGVSIDGPLVFPTCQRAATGPDRPVNRGDAVRSRPAGRSRGSYRTDDQIRW
jgi:hypothetical protein